MEYCVSSRGDMRTAELTRENLAVSDAIMGSNLIAFLAESTFGKTCLKKELKASVVIRELFVKILDGISFHFSVSPLFSYLYYYTSTFITCCQGIITLFKVLKRELTILGYWRNHKRGDSKLGWARSHNAKDL